MQDTLDCPPIKRYFHMIRIREIADADLKARIIAKLAEWRGMTVPEWFELDDADFVDLLQAIREDENPQDEYDPRM